MTRHFAPPSLALLAITPGHLLVEAIRCWRAARDEGAAVQPRLFALLTRHDCGLLAPVFDSLMRFYEGALGRAMIVGDSERYSEDEQGLAGLLDGSRILRATPHGVGHRGTAFDQTLRAIRIMIAQVLGEQAAVQPLVATIHAPPIGWPAASANAPLPRAAS